MFVIPSFTSSGTHGFSISFTNRISDVKVDIDAPGTVPQDTLYLVDPAPRGDGSTVQVQVTKWDINFVEMYAEMEAPVRANLFYTLPADYGDAEFACDFVVDRWYLPSSAYPAFEIVLFAGESLLRSYTTTDSGQLSEVDSVAVTVSSPVTVVAGEDTPDNDAGAEALPGSLSGRYFCDTNDNDVDDGQAIDKTEHDRMRKDADEAPHFEAAGENLEDTCDHHCGE